jgi:beta-lactamase class A
MNRRRALGLAASAAATAATAGVVFGATPAAADSSSTAADPSSTVADPALALPPASPEQVRGFVARVYRQETKRTGGIWNGYISVANAGGTLGVAVDDFSDDLVEAFSVNKVAVATAVLDKVDRGLLTLDQHIEVTAAIIVPGGDGIFGLDGAYPSSVTLGHALAALLTISDDTSVRLCGLVCPALEINQILVAKGFPNTQVEPVANPNRFFLGLTTPRETHDLLQALVRGTLLSPTSTAYLLGLLRSPIAFTDGIRRTMSSDERLRVATKAGWFDDGRNEAGIMFDEAGLPVLTYSLFAHGQAHPEDFGATHPAVQARAVMGRLFLDGVGALSGARIPTPHPRALYQPHNGG